MYCCITITYFVRNKVKFSTEIQLKISCFLYCLRKFLKFSIPIKRREYVLALYMLSYPFWLTKNSLMQERIDYKLGNTLWFCHSFTIGAVLYRVDLDESSPFFLNQKLRPFWTMSLTVLECDFCYITLFITVYYCYSYFYNQEILFGKCISSISVECMLYYIHFLKLIIIIMFYFYH